MPDPAAARSEGFVDLVESAELWDGEMESFDVGDDEVLVLKVGGEVMAFDGICPHQSVSLVEGELEGDRLTCRAHEWQFDVRSGRSVNPKGECLTRHEVRLTEDGMVQVRLKHLARQASSAD